MTSTFALYTQLLEQYQSDETSQSSDDHAVCKHQQIVTEHGFNLCVQCGIEIEQTLSYEKEWKYYGADSKHVADPNRCYIRKVRDKAIDTDIQNMNISEHIKDIANTIYTQSCKGKVHRGAYRRAIVFASVFHAYKVDANPQSCESLILQFKIKRKDALKGLKFINENAPKDSPVRTLYITPEHLLNEFLVKFEVNEVAKQDILQLYQSVLGKSSMLNRSRPQSVSSGLLWYWIQANQKRISIKDFVKKVNLSELTVSKIAKEIARIVESQK